MMRLAEVIDTLEPDQFVNWLATLSRNEQEGAAALILLMRDAGMEFRIACCVVYAALNATDPNVTRH